jgi:tRNA nucleotidyltransferase (CCA-adding enzyme)
MDEAGTGHFYGHSAVSRDLADGMLRRLKCGNALRETIVTLVDWHDREIPRTDKSVRRALRVLGEENLRRLLHIKRGDNMGQAPEYRHRQVEIDKGEAIMEQLLAEDACFSLKQLTVNGHDMLVLGLTGPAIGKTLNALLDAVVNGEVPNEREALFNKVKEFVTKNEKPCN